METCFLQLNSVLDKSQGVVESKFEIEKMFLLDRVFINYIKILRIKIEFYEEIGPMILGQVVNPFLAWQILLKTNVNLKEDLDKFGEAFEKDEVTQL